MNTYLIRYHNGNQDRHVFITAPTHAAAWVTALKRHPSTYSITLWAANTAQPEPV